MAQGEFRNAERSGKPFCGAHPDGAGDMLSAGEAAAPVCDGGGGGVPPGGAGSAAPGGDPLNDYKTFYLNESLERYSEVRTHVNPHGGLKLQIP